MPSPDAPAALVADTIAFSCVDGPGNRFVLFLQGCNFDCLACHNPQTIALSAPHARRRTVGDVIAELRGPAPFVSGITVSGGEATLQADFVSALFTAVKADPQLARLTTLVDSNGSCPSAVWDALAPVMDGAMIDLKCLDPELHQRLTGRGNDAVLASIVHLAAIGRLAEVRLLLVPGHNDGEALLRDTAAFLLGPGGAPHVKVIGFRRHGARHGAQQWPEATPDDLRRWDATLRAAGLSDLETV